MKEVYHGTLDGDRVQWDEGEAPDRGLGNVPVTVVINREYDPAAPLIQSREGVSGGQPCFGPYRIPVWLVVEAWQQGWTDDEILAGHPVLRRQHLAAARAYYDSHREEIDRAVVANDTL